MKYKFITILGFGFLAALPAQAETNAEISKKIEDLQNQLALLQRKVEVKEEIDTGNAAKYATVAFDKKGLAITSPDKNLTLNVKGYAQIDSRSFFDDYGKDDFLARRIRPVIEGTIYKDFSYRFMPDFAGSTTRIFDAHLDYKLYDELKFRFGKFKPPIGLERLQSATDNFFVERGHPTNLAPSRDFGFQLYGDLIPETLEYQIGVFSGNADLANTDNDEDDNTDIAGRVFAHPFRSSDYVALQGFGIGVGGSFGKHEGATTNRILPQYRTPGQQAFFTYASTAFADGDSWRIYPQGYWYYNNVGLLGEYAISSQEVTNASNTERYTHNAWQLAGSYVLTGEDVNFKGGVKPTENFDPLNSGGWGAIEVVARLGRTDIDEDALAIAAAGSSSEATSAALGLNWYWNENIKLMFDYENTEFDGGGTGGADKDSENVLFSRLQLKF